MLNKVLGSGLCMEVDCMCTVLPTSDNTCFGTDRSSGGFCCAVARDNWLCGRSNNDDGTSRTVADCGQGSRHNLCDGNSVRTDTVIGEYASRKKPEPEPNWDAVDEHDALGEGR